jgi:hypothetical protein
MTDKGMKHSKPDLTEKELAGFLRFLLAGERLPEPSEEVLAYLERLADQHEVEDEEVIDAARAARRALIIERLRAANAKPVRPFGSHLMAMRTAACCRLEDVALVLDERLETIRGLESQTVDPLNLGAPKLALVAEVFGLGVSELRETLRLALTGPAPRHLGASFARSHEDSFKSEAMRLATDDILREARARSEPVAPEVEAQVESTVAEVRSILERRGFETLLD